ncbi:Gfo/Idh/MocA family protein [Paenibacillus radicis (ex Xue et al. 2023)]|uniref:Gfo/Idh/MocA family oxidoreductase n=1 Tax=Paenibacillus radicis (ex Xue et al. 2023) TaxID=2972489 RepID=A0ABT1YQD5_9BACL|nr:Gfo/Idh/MocA family oxidoreductase [Paenibacillus radicis (ex Xue et al. 2023)]MCR8634200.1 Gfo/Idh/MocA family oxidoreductase [Paenibacillus radicis (ex Xue et al. 2023)]
MIGYNFMGKAHSNAYRQLPFFFEKSAVPVLKAIAGRNEEEVQKASRKMGWASYETDWRKLIERDDIDVIDIATPNHTHVEMAIAALEAGKHIICEKPLAITLEEAKRMKAAADRSGKVNMLMHNYRFAPAVQFAKQLICEGKLGEIRHIRAVYLNQSMIDPNRPFRWRLSKEIAGYGALGDIGSHIIDLASFLVGDFKKVSGMMETFVKSRPDAGPDGQPNYEKMIEVDVDDTSAFLAKFENGAVGVFEATRYAGGNKNGNRFEINGEKGSIRWDFEHMNELQVYFTDEDELLRGFRTINCTEMKHPYAGNYWPPGHILGYEHTFISLIYELINGVANGLNPQPNFADGVYNQAVMEAVSQSSELGRWVNISDLLGPQ